MDRIAAGMPNLRSLNTLIAGGTGYGTVPLSSTAELYMTAQEARWLDDTRFAVGRWDGSATVYEYEPHRQPALKIVAALAEQDSGGVRMIATLPDGRCASSNGPRCINVWHRDDPASTIVHLTYSGKLASATSGLYARFHDRTLLVVGHDSGFLSLWDIEEGRIGLADVMDLRASQTANPWNLQTIYGIALANDDARVVTAADSGDLCVIEPTTASLLSRLRYDVNAKRGLNDVATYGSYVLAVNCAVGSSQSNTWLYALQPDSSLKLLDSVVLRADASLPQVFAFCAEIIADAIGLIFLVATEEGLLWVGRIANDKLAIIGNLSVASHYGAAVASNNGRIVVAGDALHLYTVT